METIHHKACPACGSDKITKVFEAKDHTVRQESFEIWECGKCTIRFTQNIPSMDNIGVYYKSDNYISHSDTDRGIVNKIYHIVRNYNLLIKRNLIIRYTGKKTGNLLDIGAGTGAFVNEMKNAGWSVTGLEPDETAIDVAKSKYQLTLFKTTHLFGLEKNTFDCITLWHVLEHVHDLHQYLEQFHSLLSENGRLVIAVPNYTSYDAEYYSSSWAAYDVPRHLYHFSPTGLEALAKEKKFEIEAFVPMVFDSFYVSLLSSQYKHGKSNFLEGLLTGLVSNLKALGDPRKSSSVIYIIKKTR